MAGPTGTDGWAEPTKRVLLVEGLGCSVLTRFLIIFSAGEPPVELSHLFEVCQLLMAV